MEQNLFQMLSICMISSLNVEGWKIDLKNDYPAFDHKLYQSVLDPEECQLQLNYIRANALLTLMFTDASAKVPMSILEGNLMDLGSYHQCLSINHEVDNRTIEGKYCTIVFDIVDVINVLFSGNKNVNIKRRTLRSFPLEQLVDAYKIKMVIQSLHSMQRNREAISQIDNQNTSRVDSDSLPRWLSTGLPGLSFVVGLGVCVPKPCSPHQALSLSRIDAAPLTGGYCRLPADRPWSPADTVATVVFSLFGILTSLCTAYDVIYTFILKRDALHGRLLVFSAYRNSRRVLRAGGCGALPCLDGIRVLATLWVVLGHTLVYQNNYYNATDLLTWLQSMESLYISSAPMTVDTFFAMSGMLLVYNTCRKMNGKNIFKKVPLLYVSRGVRLSPLLGAAALLQASFLNRVSDGPLWHSMAEAAEACRAGWWITLLHLQNFFENTTCLPHSWYIAIDVQLFMVSPVVLFWLLGGSRRRAWLALAAALLGTLTTATVYNFHKNFLVNVVMHPRTLMKLRDYVVHYYHNVLTRASPFFVGMAFGYLLFINIGKRVHLSWLLVVVCWCSAGVVCAAIILSTHYALQDDWDHQIIDNFLNSFMRPAWASAIGWMVFACVHGFGGPVNLLLSLSVWRVPARLCYGVYLFHVPLIIAVVGSSTTLDFFSPGRLIFMCMGYASISFLVSYVANVIIDAPVSAIFELVLEKKETKDSKQIIERM